MVIDRHGRTEPQVVDQAVQGDLEQGQLARLRKRRQYISRMHVKPAERAFEPGAGFCKEHIFCRKLADMRPHEDLHLRSHAVPDEFLRVA